MKQAHLRVGVYWHIFPTYGEAKESIWTDPNMLFNIIPNELIARKNESELTVYFKNGSIYKLKGSDNPDSLRGPNPFGVIFDEFDTQKPDVWETIEPVIRANGGWAWFIGTPRGKQKLFEFYNRGQSGHPEWSSWLLRASTSGIISKDQMEAARASLRESFFLQEYECAFIESEGSVFRDVEEVMISHPQKPVEGRRYCMGVDLARVQDYTVCRIYDTETNELVFSDRFQHLDWSYQIQKITAYAKHYNNALSVIDSTGVGEPIADALMRKGVSVIPFKITTISKKEIVEKLALWIEQKRIKLLALKYNQENTLFEYENFSYELSSQGSVRYGARKGLHDDVVLADALAVWHLNEVYIPEFSYEPSQTQIAFARAKMDYEQRTEEGDTFGSDFPNQQEINDWGDAGEYYG